MEMNSKSLPVRFYHFTSYENGNILLETGSYDATRLNAGKRKHEAIDKIRSIQLTPEQHEAVAKVIIPIVKASEAPIEPDVESKSEKVASSTAPRKKEGGSNE